MPRLRPAPDDKKDPEITAVSSAEMEVVLAPAEPEVEVEVAEPQAKSDEATAALTKQIEALRKSEELVKQQSARFQQERDEALQRAREREAQISQVQKEAIDSQAEAISSALAAAQSELAKARADIKNAIDAGDSGGQAEALERQAIAAANLSRLQEGKDAIEARKKEVPTLSSQDPIDTWNLPKITSDWCKNHRHLLTDEKSLNKLRYFQDQVKDEGLTPHTKEFLERIEVLIGERAEPEPEVENEEAEEQPKRKGPIVSAPVSRNVPNANGKRPSGKVTLTLKEQEAARISGISNEEYAKQKVRKEEMVASGEYGEQPRQ